MWQIRGILVSPEAAYDGTAEFWCRPELWGNATRLDGELQLRIDSRADGQLWGHRHDQARPRRALSAWR
jgi:hypothetical protein